MIGVSPCYSSDVSSRFAPHHGHGTGGWSPRPPSASAPLRELDVRLDPGRSVAIVVIDKEHDPVANAKVFVVADSKLRARVTTDEDGRASVPVPAAESATLFVVAEEGPFAMMRVPRPDEKSNEKRRLQVYVLSTTSSLLIRAQTTDGKTMPPFLLLMRYNGELMPTEVAEELTDVQGLQLATGPDSEAHLRNIPSGSYEFWPYRSEAESIVAAGSSFLAPIQRADGREQDRREVRQPERTGRYVQSIARLRERPSRAIDSATWSRVRGSMEPRPCGGCSCQARDRGRVSVRALAVTMRP